MENTTPPATPISPPTPKPLPLNLILTVITLASALLTSFFLYQNRLLQQRLSAIEANQVITPTATPSPTTAVEQPQEECLVSTNTVYSCDGGYQKIISSLPGGGASYKRLDGTLVQCPVIAPQYVTPECKELASLNCTTLLCQSSK